MAQIINNRDTTIDVTFTLDTSQYADGDVLSDTAAITNAAAGGGQGVLLVNFTLIDKADQGQALKVFFFDSNVSLGTKNAAPNISDANAASVLGFIEVASSDYVDLGGVRVASKNAIGLVLKPSGTSVYVALLSGGTGTYAADSLVGRFGLSR